MAEHVHGHEEKDVKTRPLVLFFVIFAVFFALAFVIVKWSYHALVQFENSRQKDRVTRVASEAVKVPESLNLRAGGPEVTTLPANAPLLQPDPVRDMDAMRAEQLAKLNSYGWIDREKGIVHVPIDRAMAMAIERSMVKAQSPDPSAASAAPAAPQASPAAAPAAR